MAKKAFVPFKKKAGPAPATKSAPKAAGKPSVTPGQKSGPGYMGC